MSNIINDIKNSTVSPVKDPFNKSSFCGMTLFVMKSVWNDGFRFSANVDFKNGDTNGSQSIEATDFDSLLISVKAFFDTLK